MGTIEAKEQTSSQVIINLGDYPEAMREILCALGEFANPELANQTLGKITQRAEKTIVLIDAFSESPIIKPSEGTKRQLHKIAGSFEAFHLWYSQAQESGRKLSEVELKNVPRGLGQTIIPAAREGLVALTGLKDCRKGKIILLPPTP